MKFNRLHIVLISLISIFLLLSISAASAANDADAIASDMGIHDIFEVNDIHNDINYVEILSQGDETYVSDEPDSSGDEGEDCNEPINVVINTMDDTFSYGNDVKINFTLRDNCSNNINITNKSNFKFFYKNETSEEFNKTSDFNSTNESQETNVSLNITKTNTRIDANDTKVKIGDDIMIPLKILDVDSNKALNANAISMEVICNCTVYNCTIITDGNNIIGIKIIDFPKESGIYNIRIKYLGDDNYIESTKSITLFILGNNALGINTLIFADNVNVDFKNHHVTVPISVNDGVNNIPLEKKDITLVMVYDNGTEKVTMENASFKFSGDEGKYNINFANGTIPFNDANLTIIYADGTSNETDKTIAFNEKNNLFTENTINVNNTGNVTIPISIKKTSHVSYDSKDIANDDVLNLTTEDMVRKINLVLTYNNGTDNIQVPVSSDNITFDDKKGTYDVSFSLNEVVDSAEAISFDNATVNIDYANETNKTVTLKDNRVSNKDALKESRNLKITPINPVNDYQDGEFTFKVTDKDGKPIPNAKITVRGLWFYTFGDTSSTSPSKKFTTDANGILRIKNENMNSKFYKSVYGGFIALPVGSYSLTFTSEDPSLVLNSTINITVNKVQAKIIASNMVSEFGNIVHYSYRIVNSKTNAPIKIVNAQFRICGDKLDDTRVGYTDKSGYYTSPKLNLNANKYTLKLMTNDPNLKCSQVTKTLTVNKGVATITASSRTVYYGATDDMVLIIKNKKGKVLANTYVLLKVYSGSKKPVSYAVISNKKGVLTFSPSPALTVGKHKVLMYVLNKNYKSATLTRYITVKKAPTKFTASNVKTYYRSGRLFKVKLINTKTKKGLYGAKVRVKIYLNKKRLSNDVLTTNKKGFVQFGTKFKPSTYKVVVSNNGDTGYSAKKVTKKIRVTKHPLRLKAVKLKVERLTNFKVKVISKKTKKGLSAVKLQIKVYTGKKFKTYTRKSNKKGFTYLKVKEKKGKHKVIVSVKSPKYYTANKIKKNMKVVVIIHPIKFKAVNLTVKRGMNFKVKVINKKTKKVQSGATVQIKVFTGKKFRTYTKTSNKKGIINLKIKECVGKHKVIVSAKDPKICPSKQLKETIRVIA